MTTVEKVMTHNPITVEIPGSRNDVLKLMVKHNLTGVPIVKKTDGSLAGMISRSDIFTNPEEDQLAMVMLGDGELSGRSELTIVLFLSVPQANGGGSK